MYRKIRCDGYCSIFLNFFLELNMHVAVRVGGHRRGWGDTVGRAGCTGEVVEEQTWEGGGEVEVEGCVERGGGVCGDAVGVGLGGAEEVDGGGVGDLLARLVDGEVEGDAVLAEVGDAEQRRE